MQVIKRNGLKEEFNPSKIENAVFKAFEAQKYNLSPGEHDAILMFCNQDICGDDWMEHPEQSITVESIQDSVEKFLMSAPEWFEVGKAYMLYREQHNESRFVRSRIDYINKYSSSGDNASTASETDANANVSMKNVANLEGEVYKRSNRVIQRQRMKDKLNELYPELAKQYEKDLENHIIYVHDEASSPVPKKYCLAASLYPLMSEGVGNVDGVTPTPPNDIQSFSGQVTNLTFLLSSQAKGAVALGEYIVALNYYVIAEFGPKWYDKLDVVISNEHALKKYTIKSYIRKGMKQFIYGVSQPAGNRSYNSPFSNISYYDKTYFHALFDEFCYPDGTKPEWKAIDTLQRIFMELHRELRLIKPLTFPVTTMAMVHDGKDVIDKEYKELCAEEWAKGGSFFCYLSDNPSSLASCCRVLNEITDNTFSSINGLQGIMTGSCNVITLNLNRIIQDWFREHCKEYKIPYTEEEIKKRIVNSGGYFYEELKEYLKQILDRVYKYHIAYKTILYELEDKGMFADSNAGYIYLKKLYSTIGLIGYCEAAQFLGMKINNNKEYKDFLKFIFGTVKEQNKLHSIHDKKRPFLFNSEAIPGENLAVKLYEWDKKDNYYVPENQNLYSSYFFLQWDKEIPILDKLKLHGKYINSACDGGQACHIHLEEHLSKEQYLKIIDFCIKEGVNYFTFNIPVSECKDCGHVVNAPITTCPKCGSTKIDWWVRIIGFLRPISTWAAPRQLESKKRVYSNGKSELKDL